jgi:hypothetical protein
MLAGHQMDAVCHDCGRQVIARSQEIEVEVAKQNARKIASRDLINALIESGADPVEARLCAWAVHLPLATQARAVRLCDRTRGLDSAPEPARSAATALWLETRLWRRLRRPGMTASR